MKDFKPMECPVCHKYYFTDDTYDEMIEDDYEDEYDDYCPFCGWKYDLYQTEHPNIRGLTNELSLNEYINTYELKVKENPQYDYLDENYSPTPHMCPVCAEYEFSDVGSFEICPNCGWQDDDLMEQEPDKWEGNSNELCLNDYREMYIKSKNNKQ